MISRRQLAALLRISLWHQEAASIQTMYLSNALLMNSFSRVGSNSVAPRMNFQDGFFW